MGKPLGLARSSRTRGREGRERGAEAMNTKNTSRNSHTQHDTLHDCSHRQPTGATQHSQCGIGKKVPRTHIEEEELQGEILCNLPHIIKARALYNSIDMMVYKRSWS